MRATASSLAGIEEMNAHGLKIRNVASDDGQAMDRGCCGNEGIAFGSRVRHVQPRATLRDRDVHGQNPPLDRSIGAAPLLALRRGVAALVIVQTIKRPAGGRQLPFG